MSSPFPFGSPITINGDFADRGNDLLVCASEELLTENDRFGPVRKGNKLGLLPLTTISQEPVARDDTGDKSHRFKSFLSQFLSHSERKRSNALSHVMKLRH